MNSLHYRLARQAIPLFLAAFLAACAPGSCDPSTAGFFSGMSCQASGAYDLREGQLRGDLASARADLAAQRNRANYAAIDAGRAQAEQSGLSRRLAVMGTENAALRARLNQAARRQGVDQAAVQRQQADLAQLERDRNAAARANADSGQIAELERRRRVLLDAAAGL